MSLSHLVSRRQSLHYFSRFFPNLFIAEAGSSEKNKKVANIMPEELYKQNEQDFTKKILARLDVHDHNTYKHCIRVRDLAVKIGQEAGLNKEKIDLLAAGALLHDIGKLSIDEKILNKPGKLDDAEWMLVKQHPQNGYSILKESGIYEEEICEMVRDHHERYDGKGYNHRARISELTNILIIADSIEAMIGLRPYRYVPKTIDEAIEEICLNSGKQFDPHFCDAAIDVLERDFIF